MNPIRTIHKKPLQIINYTELLFAFVAHTLTIPYIGILTGLICGCAVHYTIQIQQDGAKPATRRQAFYGTLLFKVGQLWIHQTSFLFMFEVSGKTLPFGWALDTWAWITTVFIFSIDVWALSVTSQEAAERAEAAEIAESLKRMEEKEAADRAERLAREEADRQARAERDAADRTERLELARIKADAKKAAKLASEETRRKTAEEARKTAEAVAEVERTKVEAERKAAELKWKAEEDARSAVEQRRKEEEAERKEAEAEQKAAEQLREAEEAKIRLEREARDREAQQAEEQKKEAQRQIWREQKAKRKAINGNMPETAQAEAI